MPSLTRTLSKDIDGRFDERAIWEALLKQSEANLKQSEANKAISDAILAHTQRMICDETAAAMEPARFVVLC